MLYELKALIMSPVVATDGEMGVSALFSSMTSPGRFAT